MVSNVKRESWIPFFFLILSVSFLFPACSEREKEEQLNELVVSLNGLEAQTLIQKYTLDSLRTNLSGPCQDLYNPSTSEEIGGIMGEIENMKIGIGKFSASSKGLDEDAFSIGIADYYHRISLADNSLYYIELNIKQLDSCMHSR